MPINTKKISHIIGKSQLGGESGSLLRISNVCILLIVSNSDNMPVPRLIIRLMVRCLKFNLCIIDIKFTSKYVKLCTVIYGT